MRAVRDSDSAFVARGLQQLSVIPVDAGQEALSERGVSEQADAEVLAGPLHPVRFGRAMHKAVLNLRRQQ